MKMKWKVLVGLGVAIVVLGIWINRTLHRMEVERQMQGVYYRSVW